MSPVEFKKAPCCPVEFKGQGRHLCKGIQCKGDRTLNHIDTLWIFYYGHVN